MNYPTYEEMCEMRIDDLKRVPCRCVSCAACGGTGTIRVHSVVDYDLISCSDCRGSGSSEICDRCRLVQEDESEEGWD